MPEKKKRVLKETRGNGLSAPDKLHHTATSVQLKMLRNKKQLQHELVIHTNMVCAAVQKTCWDPLFPIREDRSHST